MAAGIESDDYMFSGSGVMPWHGTQVTVVDGRLTAKEALEAAKLDWRVIKEPIVVQRSGIIIPRTFAVTRDSDGKPLGVVQQRYQPLQNEDAFDWANYMVGGDGAHFETAGSLKGGRVVYVTLKTPYAVDLPGGDRLETYVLISNRHDGNGSVVAAIITIRVVCSNTLARSIAGALGSIRIPHTKNLAVRMQQAQKVLGLAQGATDRAEETAIKLLQQKMSDKKFDAFLDLLVRPEVAANEEPTPRQLAAVTRLRNSLTEVYQNQETQQDIRGTAWGAYNAVTFYHDQLIPRREMSDSDSTPADARMLAIVGGDRNIGDEALDILMDGIGGGRWLTGKSKSRGPRGISLSYGTSVEAGINDFVENHDVERAVKRAEALRGS